MLAPAELGRPTACACLDYAPSDEHRGIHWCGGVTLDRPDRRSCGSQRMVVANAQGVRVVKTEMILDDVVMAASSNLMPRADIAAEFNRPDFEQSGWRYVLSTKNLPPDEHEIRLRAIGSDVGSGIVLSRPLSIMQ